MQSISKLNIFSLFYQLTSLPICNTHIQHCCDVCKLIMPLAEERQCGVHWNEEEARGGSIQTVPRLQKKRDPSTLPSFNNVEGQDWCPYTLASAGADPQKCHLLVHHPACASTTGCTPSRPRAAIRP